MDSSKDDEILHHMLLSSGRTTTNIDEVAGQQKSKLVKEGMDSSNKAKKLSSAYYLNSAPHKVQNSQKT